MSEELNSLAKEKPMNESKRKQHRDEKIADEPREDFHCELRRLERENAKLRDTCLQVRLELLQEVGEVPVLDDDWDILHGLIVQLDTVLGKEQASD